MTVAFDSSCFYTISDEGTGILCVVHRSLRYDMDPSLFEIKDDPSGGYVAILMSLNVDNIKVIETAMTKLGFNRTNPTDHSLLEDMKNRLYVNLRFAPTLQKS